MKVPKKCAQTRKLPPWAGSEPPTEEFSRFSAGRMSKSRRLFRNLLIVDRYHIFCVEAMECFLKFRSREVKRRRQLRPMDRIVDCLQYFEFPVYAFSDLGDFFGQRSRNIVLVVQVDKCLVNIRNEQFLSKEIDLLCQFVLNDVEIECRLYQPKHVFDVVSPTCNRFEQEDILGTDEFDRQLTSVEIAATSPAHPI